MFCVFFPCTTTAAGRRGKGRGSYNDDDGDDQGRRQGNGGGARGEGKGAGEGGVGKRGGKKGKGARRREKEEAAERDVRQQVHTCVGGLIVVAVSSGMDGANRLVNDISPSRVKLGGVSQGRDPGRAEERGDRSMRLDD